MLAVVKSAPLDGPEGTAVRDCPIPVPGPDEVLIRVAAAAICCGVAGASTDQQ